ncbi:hypothetical protein AURDEDRAFT_186185 [Auricularia subglabra TFB-10046 SS5]|nr:hypothetical protein AURDEDRAFT_186185 [Auricularia subglabra TFB-10046 SS5]
MWSDSESDDDYDGPEQSVYKFPARGALELRLYRDLEHEAKRYMLSRYRRDEAHADRVLNQRAALHKQIAQDDLEWSADWTTPRVERFFHEMAGFHLGELDLTGRFEGRYEKLKARWDAYVPDFLALAPHVGLVPVTRRDVVFDEANGYSIVTKTIHVRAVTNHAVWSAFRTKWKLSPLQNYEDLAELTGYTCKSLMRHPTPKFQMLSLVDLPPEIVQDIFVHATLNSFTDSCRLASTSKYLHDVGRRLIYISRKLLLGKTFAYHTLPLDYRPEARFAACAEAMKRDRDLLIDQLDFLASRADICQKIQILLVCNNWCSIGFSNVEQEFYDVLLDTDMFGPILTRLNGLLPSTSLGTITTMGFPIDARFLQCLLQQSKLNDATFSYCRLTPSAERFLAALAGSNNVSALPLRRLDFLLANADGQTSIWAILALCPHLRQLIARAIRRDVGFHLPPPIIYPRLAGVVRSLEYLDLQGIGSWELNLVLLLDLLRAAVAAGPLSITHLRLAFTYGIDDVIAAEIVERLHAGSSPLAILILDGLALPGPPTLIDLIAQHFPDLDGLTLTRRANERQRELKQCFWPLPTYEYAARLSTFRKLRYFGANFSYNSDALWPDVRNIFDTPVSDDMDQEDVDEWHETDGADASEILYHQALARPFAAHCPSLEFFALPATMYYCHIKRAASGAVTFHDAMLKGRSAAYAAMKAYDPAVMWSDSESDGEYFGPDRRCALKPRKQELELRFLQKHEIWAKENMVMPAARLGMRPRQGADADYGVDGRSERVFMRELSLRDDLDAMKDWRAPRVKRFFYDMAGFHLGQLDLSGRFRTRYAKLRARWDVYLIDYLRLAPFVAVADVVRRGLGPDLRVVDVTVSIPVVTDTARWLEFRRRWQLSPHQQYEDIAPPTEYVLEVVDTHPIPRFQQLMLDHLPPEIILRIFAHVDSTEDCCRLAATVRYFRAIGLGFIYSSRVLALGTESAWSPYLQPAATEGLDPAAIWERIEYDLQTLVDQMEYLAAHPDICRQLRHLEFKNNWCPIPFFPPNTLSFALILNHDHFAFALERLCTILSAATIVTLTMLYWPMDVDAVLAFARQTQLIEARFQFCLLTPAAQQFLASGPLPALSSSLRYIDFDLTSGEAQSSSWGILALCPSLTHLSARARPNAGFSCPSHDLLLRLSSTLRSIERLDLYGLSSSDAPQLALWVQDAAARGNLGLTHLRVLFDHSVPDIHIAELLRAIHSGSPPLEVLILDGPALRGALPILELIGQLFPDLEGLTLMRLAGMRRDDRRSCHWPLPIYEYAPELAPFAKLRYLSTNFKHDFNSLWPEIGEFFDGVTPDGVISDVETWREREEMRREYGPESQGRALSYQALVRPFAACCRSLEFFALHPESDLDCYIERTESGTMRCSGVMTREDPAERSAMREYYSRYTWNRPGL